jgi:hypothetical protein
MFISKQGRAHALNQADSGSGGRDHYNKRAVPAKLYEQEQHLFVRKGADVKQRNYENMQMVRSIP